jgi:hypothetical protein
LSEDLGISIFTPVGSPNILNNPVLSSVDVLFPSDDFDNVLSIELESIFSSVVESFLVSEEVSEDGHLCNDWTVLEDFLLNVLLV